MAKDYTTATRIGHDVIDDKRIKNIRPLIPPQILMEDFPLSLDAASTIVKGRKGIESILKGEDDRLVVIVGPCSVHDVDAALVYADRLRAYAETCAEDLHIIMRVYFEKPRTTVGWKGLINDPEIDGSYQINKGLRLARSLLLEIANRGLPTAVEFLDTISPQFIADLVSWGAIGARTTESQVHRELASGLSAPVGFKNGTDGSVDIAMDALRACKQGHVFLSVTKQGLTAIVETEGNEATHIILRGSNKGPNYSKEHVSAISEKAQKAGLQWRLMVDCSHGNSQKKHENQKLVAEDITRQLGEEGGERIMGVMLESNLVAGKQSVPASGTASLTYGQSITDACMDWEMTVQVLDTLRQGVRARRERCPFKKPLNTLETILNNSRSSPYSSSGLRSPSSSASSVEGK